MRRNAIVQRCDDFGENSRVGKLMSWHCRLVSGADVGRSGVLESKLIVPVFFAFVRWLYVRTVNV